MFTVTQSSFRIIMLNVAENAKGVKWGVALSFLIYGDSNSSKGNTVDASQTQTSHADTHTRARACTHTHSTVKTADRSVLVPPKSFIFTHVALKGQWYTVIKICTQDLSRGKRGLRFRENLFTVFGLQAPDCRMRQTLPFSSPILRDTKDKRGSQVNFQTHWFFIYGAWEGENIKWTQNGMLRSDFQLFCVTGNCKAKRTALISIINAYWRTPVTLQWLNNTKEGRQSLEDTSSLSCTLSLAKCPGYWVFFLCSSTCQFASPPLTPWKFVQMTR